MNVTPEQLLAIMPQANKVQIGICAGPVNGAMARFDINTPARIAHFIAQIAHESKQLAATRENLNYSADQLARVWPRRYALMDKRPNDLAKEHARMGAQTIANNVYANRMGNGDAASGDGWRHRGAGFIQLTGKANQQECADCFGVSSDIGDWLASPQGAALSAAWYWEKHRCNELADKGDVDGISDTINFGRRTMMLGDAIGYADRLALTNRALEVLT